jgi:ABC-type proline/glycine betaine transport system ATPase subunit
MEMTRFSDVAIRTRGLRKVFSGKVAVRNLTLDVPRGEVFGFLGPNGAGKSTSVKMLLGLVLPTSGEAQILGCPVGDVKTRSRVGFLPEHFRFYDWLTPTELLKLHGRLYGMSHAKLRERVPVLLDLVGRFSTHVASTAYLQLSPHGSSSTRMPTNTGILRDLIETNGTFMARYSYHKRCTPECRQGYHVVLVNSRTH